VNGFPIGRHEKRHEKSDQKKYFWDSLGSAALPQNFNYLWPGLRARNGNLKNGMRSAGAPTAARRARALPGMFRARLGRGFEWASAALCGGDSANGNEMGKLVFWLALI
jgi:hypothetical protein